MPITSFCSTRTPVTAKIWHFPFPHHYVNTISAMFDQLSCDCITNLQVHELNTKYKRAYITSTHSGFNSGPSKTSIKRLIIQW